MTGRRGSFKPVAIDLPTSWIRAIGREFAGSPVDAELLESIGRHVRQLADRLSRIADVEGAERGHLVGCLLIETQTETASVATFLAASIRDGVHETAGRLGLDEVEESALAERAVDAALTFDRKLAALHEG